MLAIIRRFLLRLARDARLHHGIRNTRLTAFVARIQPVNPIVLEPLYQTDQNR